MENKTKRYVVRSEEGYRDTNDLAVALEYEQLFESYGYTNIELYDTETDRFL